MILPLALLGAALLQEPAEPAVALVRALRRELASQEDVEARLRLAAIARRMSDVAEIALRGDPEDPEALVLRLYEAGSLTRRPPDSRCRDFWKWVLSGAGPLVGADFTIETAPSGPIHEEMLVDLIRYRTGTHHWDAGRNSITRTPHGQLLIEAPPLLQRKIGKVIRDLHRDAIQEVRLSVALLASDAPLAAGAEAGGTVSDELWERLGRQADESGAVRRLGTIETSARMDQTVSAFSGTRHSVAMASLGGELAKSSLSEGFALEARALPSGDRILLRIRLSHTKVLGFDEVATSQGTLRLPRLVESGFTDDRTVPSGKRVVLGAMGPLPPESGLPLHVTVFLRALRTPCE